jgi:hypothetical protein
VTIPRGSHMVGHVHQSHGRVVTCISHVVGHVHRGSDARPLVMIQVWSSTETPCCSVARSGLIPRPRRFVVSSCHQACPSCHASLPPVIVARHAPAGPPARIRAAQPSRPSIHVASSSTGPRQPGAVTSSVGDWSVRAYDGRCRTGRVGRPSGLEAQCTAQPGPAAAERRLGLGRTWKPRMGPGAWCLSGSRELPMLGRRGRVTRLLREESKERDAGRARLDRVGGDSWRTGPGRTRIQNVPLERMADPDDGSAR